MPTVTITFSPISARGWARILAVISVMLLLSGIGAITESKIERNKAIDRVAGAMIAMGRGEEVDRGEIGQRLQNYQMALGGDPLFSWSYISALCLIVGMVTGLGAVLIRLLGTPIASDISPPNPDARE